MILARERQRPHYLREGNLFCPPCPGSRLLPGGTRPHCTPFTMGSRHLPQLSVSRPPLDLRPIQTSTSCWCLRLNCCVAVAMSPLAEKQEPRSTLDYRGILGKAANLLELPLSPVVGRLQSQMQTLTPHSALSPFNSKPSAGDENRTPAFHPTPQMLTAWKGSGLGKSRVFLLSRFFPVLRECASSASFYPLHAMEITGTLGARFEQASGSMTFDGQGPGHLFLGI